MSLSSKEFWSKRIVPDADERTGFSSLCVCLLAKIMLKARVAVTANMVTGNTIKFIGFENNAERDSSFCRYKATTMHSPRNMNPTAIKAFLREKLRTPRAHSQPLFLSGADRSAFVEFQVFFGEFIHIHLLTSTLTSMIRSSRKFLSA